MVEHGWYETSLIASAFAAMGSEGRGDEEEQAGEGKKDGDNFILQKSARLIFHPEIEWHVGAFVVNVSIGSRLPGFIGVLVFVKYFVNYASHVGNGKHLFCRETKYLQFLDETFFCRTDRVRATACQSVLKNAPKIA